MDQDSVFSKNIDRITQFIFYSRIKEVSIDDGTFILCISTYNSPHVFTIEVEESEASMKLHELNICKKEKHQMVWRLMMDQKSRKHEDDPVKLSSFPTHRALVPWSTQCSHDEAINCEACNEKTQLARWCAMCSKHAYLLCDRCVCPLCCYECTKTHYLNNECISKKTQ